MNEKKTISFSSLSLYSQCSRRWYFTYVSEIDKPIRSPHLVFGTAIHKSIEDLSRSMVDRPIITLDAMIKSFSETWINGTNEDQIDWQAKNQANKMYSLGIELVTQYYMQYSDYTPLEYLKDGKLEPAVEVKFKVPILNPKTQKQDEKNELSGIIDLVATNKNGDICVIDHKTSSAKYSPFKINTSTQLILYAYAFREIIKQGIFPNIKKKKEDYVGFNILLKKYRVDPSIDQEYRKIKDDQITQFLYELQDIIKGIENEIYIPNRTDMCDNPYIGCQFLEECENFKYASKPV